jgi:hypothetical protein
MNAWTKSGSIGICWAMLWCSFAVLVGDSLGQALALTTAKWCLPFLLLSLACGWGFQFARRRRGNSWITPIAISLAVYVALFAFVGGQIVGGDWTAVVDIAFLPILFGLPSFLYLCIYGANPRTTKGPNHSTEPTPTAGTSAAGHPPRQP